MPPITRLRNPSPDGLPILTHPMDIDALMRNTMGAIYQGNVPPSRKDFLLDAFLRKFGQPSIRAEPYQVPDLHWYHLQQAIHHSPDNTPGMNGVRQGHLLLFCPNALWLITQLLIAIEQASPWPAATNCARTAYVSKGEDDLSPTSYRGLAILSKLYRLWATIRLEHV